MPKRVEGTEKQMPRSDGGNPSQNSFRHESDLDKKTREITKVVQPSWNLGGTLVEPCQELVEPWWNLRGTLVEPSAELLGRKQFCPETFTMAEDLKAIAVGGKTRSGSDCFYKFIDQ